MAVNVVGPLGDPEKAAIAANLLLSGRTVVVWDEDPAGLQSGLEALPRTPPGRLCTWTGHPSDAGLQAFISEVLDPPVK